MGVIDAKNHVEEAFNLLTGTYWAGDGSEESWPVCIIALELERIDGQLGPKGHSMFAPMAEKLHAAYVELMAARKALE